jgi:glycosyltransferase involved in cell wall biosynthesis
VRYGGRPGAVTLLYVGRISKEKNLDVIGAAWRELREAHESIQLAFVGDGPYVSELRAAYPEAVFTGYLSGEALATAYASSDIFLFPSTTDTFGNVLLEAQAAGLPAVVSNAGGPRELVEDGVTGYVTPALDSAAFAEAVAKLICDPALRKQMGMAGHAAVQTRNWAVAVRQFLSAQNAD